MIALLLLAALQVDQQYERFSTAYATLDADRVTQMYTEDALMLPPGGEILRGRAAIREQYTDGFDSDRMAHQERQLQLGIQALIRDTSSSPTRAVRASIA